MEIMSGGDFKKYFAGLVEKMDFNTVRPLGEYLRALLGLIYTYKECAPTYNVFREILEGALRAEPLGYQLSWESYKEPPFLFYEPHPDDFENLLIDPQTGDVVSKFDVLEKTLMFQIAEYKRVFENGVIPEETPEPEEAEDRLYRLGWGTSDTVVYLDSAVAYVNEEYETECDWLTLTDMLEYARTADMYGENLNLEGEGY